MDAEGGREGTEEIGLELSALVGSDDIWLSETGNPIHSQRKSDGVCGNVVDGPRLRPTRETVDTGE